MKQIYNTNTLWKTLLFHKMLRNGKWDKFASWFYPLGWAPLKSQAKFNREAGMFKLTAGATGTELPDGLLHSCVTGFDRLRSSFYVQGMASLLSEAMFRNLLI
jgi:hypothetical protein